MTKIVVVMWIALLGTAAGGVITYVRMSGAIEELEGTVERQRTELGELSDAVGRMSQMVRQVVTLSSMRGDDDAGLDPRERPRVRSNAPEGSVEAQIDELNDLILPYKDMMDQELRRKELRAAARERMEADRERYSEEELEEMRELYRGGRGRRDDPERRQNLEQLVQKYPESSMTGCALLQLARGADPQEAESYYLKAIQGHSDSYCHGGMPVGAMARDRLAEYYEENGQGAKAVRLRGEIKRDFPGAADHHGDPF